MVSCWKADSQERLSFFDLENAIERVLTNVADYLDINEFTLALDHSTENKSDNTEKNNSTVDIMELSP